MSEFSFDTSGFVTLRREDASWKGRPRPDIYWEDLTPFAQGYVEALFAGSPALHGDGSDTRDAGFRDLSPEALAMILGDCEQRLSVGGDWPNTTTAGEMFWLSRQRGRQVAFPPLTPYLSDDGKVCLKPSGSDQ